MIRICVAGERSVTSTVLGDTIAGDAFEIHIDRLTDIVEIEGTWQYEQKNKALVDISDVLEGIFSDDV